MVSYGIVVDFGKSPTTLTALDKICMGLSKSFTGVCSMALARAYTGTCKGTGQAVSGKIFGRHIMSLLGSDLLNEGSSNQPEKFNC